MTENELLELKKKIDSAKQEQNQLEGAKALLMKQLSEQFGCTTLEQAVKKVETMEKDLLKMNTKLTKLTNELEEKLNG